MGFQQGLSGLDVSSKALDAIGNNVANTSTVGFKQSKAIFADVYASTVRTSAGVGSTVQKVQQEFTQGNLSTSNNPLDVGVNGNGLFRLSNAGTISFSRNGQFTTDRTGNIISSGGQNLTGYGVDTLGNIVPGTFTDLKVTTANIAPRVTTASKVQMNLDSRSVPPTALQHGSVTGSSVPILGSFAAARTLDVTVDGLLSGGLPIAVTIPGAVYTSSGQLATAVQTAINSNLNIIAGKAFVDVTISSTGFMQITSRSVGTIGSQGQGSTVAVAAPAADPTLVTDLMGAGPVTVAGTDNFNPADSTSFTVSTAQVEFDALGNPHTLNMYFVKASADNTWQTYTTLDGVVPVTALVTGNTAPTTTAAGGGGLDQTLTFPIGGITIDGIASRAVITVNPAPTVTHTAASLAAAVQTAINADFSAAPTTGRSVSVTTNGAGALIITSNLTVGAPSVTIAADVAPNTSRTLMLGTTPISTTLTGPLPTSLVFNRTGALTTTMPLSQSFNISSGATSPLNFTLDYTGSTQYGSTFGVSQLQQDGFTSGRLTGLSISLDGIIQGRYSNGKTQNMGQVVTANFNNLNGLQPLGNNQWAETAESGQPIVGTPNSGNLGSVQSGTLEEANVDLTRELVNMITQQRTYQANAQTIKTQDQVLSTLVNLR